VKPNKSEEIDKPVKDRAYLQKLIASKKQVIQSDNPSVEIARMNIEAVGKLADDKNDVFSQLTKDSLQDETIDYALAIVFARRPLQSLEERLAKRGIVELSIKHTDLGDIEEETPIKIKVDVFESFLREFLIRRHCLNRGRVEEYIKALDKANGKDMLMQDPSQRRTGLLSRLG
jgi:hypothetical protein